MKDVTRQQYAYDEAEKVEVTVGKRRSRLWLNRSAITANSNKPFRQCDQVHRKRFGEDDRALSDQQYAEFDVLDTGMGMSEEQRRSLFDHLAKPIRR